MKKYYINILMIIMMSTFTCCTLEDFNPSEWAVEPELSFSESGLVFNATTGKHKIYIQTNYEKFTYYSDQDWCKVVEVQDSSCIEIEVEPNMSTEPRQATIQVTVSRGNKILSKNVSVVQFGGYWDVVNGFALFWSYDVSDSQKEIIRNLLSNLVYVEGGTFYMGGQSEDPNGMNYISNLYSYITQSIITSNIHKVNLSDYYISKYELTQKEWIAIMGYNNSQFKGELLPVENISWEEALEFTARISELTGLSIQLPTDSQWEYAARGGIRSAGYTYPGSDDEYEIAHIVESDVSVTSPSYTTVKGGTKLHNELGLYDMAGNVAEYCSDWYDDYDLVAVKTDPIGPSSGKYKVVRGGNFTDSYWVLPVFWRSISTPSRVKELTGFRVVVKP